MFRLPQHLRNGLWHSTSYGRYVQILESGAILPEPSIADNERHGTAMGPDFYPFVRWLGGVSLFDFRDFDERNYGERFPMSNWQDFVPRPGLPVGRAVWIGIDRAQVQQSLIEGHALTARWQSESAYHHKVMPMIEAAHVGAVPRRSFLEVWQFAAERWSRVVPPDHSPNAAA
jgi:hypothetical protein